MIGKIKSIIGGNPKEVIKLKLRKTFDKNYRFNNTKINLNTKRIYNTPIIINSMNRLTFLKRQELIQGDILVDQEEIELNPERTPQNVEYYFDFRVDKEIPILEICKGIGKLNSQNPISDFEIVCPDIRKRNPTDIYGSNITDQDIEDCTTKEECD